VYTRLDRAHRGLPVVLGVVAFISIALLFVWDTDSQIFSKQLHAVLEAFSLASIAVAYLLYQSAHRPQAAEWFKAIMLAVAFLCWAANQIWPEPKQALLLNDLAIALFVLDVFLVMIGWPNSSQDESFAEAHTQAERNLTPHGNERCVEDSRARHNPDS
jgi:hypothetical protein